MGVSGRLYTKATLTQKIDDWCASHVRCFEDMGCVSEVVVPDNIKPTVIKPSRYKPVLNEPYADLLEHYDVQGFPAHVRKTRDNPRDCRAARPDPTSATARRCAGRCPGLRAGPRRLR